MKIKVSLQTDFWLSSRSGSTYKFGYIFFEVFNELYIILGFLLVFDHPNIVYAAVTTRILKKLQVLY